MSRAAAAQAKQAQATAAANAAQYGANAAGMFGPLTTQAKSLIDSTGYDPATLAAITNAGMGGVNAGFGGAAAQIKRNAATTKNQAGVTGGEDALARAKGEAGGREAGDIQIKNADYANSQRLSGLNLLNSLYGANLNAQTGNEQTRTGDINAEIAASPGWAQSLGGVLSGIGSVIKPINVKV